MPWNFHSAIFYYLFEFIKQNVAHISLRFLCGGIKSGGFFKRKRGNIKLCFSVFIAAQDMQLFKFGDKLIYHGIFRLHAAFKKRRIKAKYAPQRVFVF